MLVTLSFGLVLVATVLLGLGIFSDSGLPLIYASIGASILAGIVLIVAVRMSRPKPKISEAPGPIGDDEVAQAAGVSARGESSEATDVAQAPPVGETYAATPAVEEKWADAAPDWEGSTAAAESAQALAEPVDDQGYEFEFPIADYDDLTVAEIVPLLPQLYSDELDVVAERERATKDRVTVLSKIEELRETGTEADAELEPAPAAALEPTADPVPEAPQTEIIEPATAQTPPPAVAEESSVQEAPAEEAFAPAVDAEFAPAEDIDFDDEEFFPIEGYDDLNVTQITPLLGQLEQDELVDVRAREVAGSNRVTLLRAIDDELGGQPAEPAPPPAKPAAPKKRAASKRKSASKAQAAPKRKAASKKTAAKKAPSKRKAASKKTAAPKKSATPKRAATKKTAPKKAAAKKTAASKKKRATKKRAAKKR